MKPKVVHVLEAFAGGTERHLLDLVEYVPGFEHVLAVPSRHLGRSTARAVEIARALGATVELIEMCRAPSPVQNASAIRSLRALLRRIRPAVVHGHSSIGGAVSRVAAVGHEVPVVYTPNCISRSPWALAVERALGPRTDRLIAVSAGEAEFALRKRLIPPGRLTVIPNGITLEQPERLSPSLRELLGVAVDTPLVGCLGRLTEQKAPEVYIAACGIAGERLPEAHFFLVGNGAQRARAERALAATRLNGRFHWLEELPGAAGGFGEMDLYVLASRFEGGPYTPLEAMRARTPVIVTDVAGNRDTIEHGACGLVVPADDPPALGKAIVELMNDPPRRSAFARAGADRVAARFDVRTMGEQTGRVYEEVALVGGVSVSPLRRIMQRVPVA
jgi:glycosyltransferase involved in cell wall biosynthesis